MPALSATNNDKTVLVTGANGFIATYIVGYLLDKGYSVRAALRSVAKGTHLKELYVKYGDKLSFVEIGDMQNPTAFNEAVKDVHGIIHTASPVGLGAGHPDEFIKPALQGIVGLLESAKKNANVLERIVFTSSCAAILHFALKPTVVSEDRWNDNVAKVVEEKGADADGLSKYCSSKYYAEKAAWKFIEENKAIIKWDFTVINPPWVLGPSSNGIKSFETLNEGDQILYNAIIKGEFMGFSPLTTPGHGVADVRDVAAAHIKALETPEAAGERVIICAEPFVWQDLVNAANALSPKPYTLKPLHKGEEGEIIRNITWNLEKEKRLYGIKFRTISELIRDTLAEWQEKGW